MATAGVLQRAANRRASSTWRRAGASSISTSEVPAPLARPHEGPKQVLSSTALEPLGVPLHPQAEAPGRRLDGFDDAVETIPLFFRG